VFQLADQSMANENQATPVVRVRSNTNRTPLRDITNTVVNRIVVRRPDPSNPQRVVIVRPRVVFDANVATINTPESN